MSRHGYIEDEDENGQVAMWRGVVASATRGKRGQAFFRALLAALDAMTEKRLVAGELEENGEYCALGVLAAAKGALVADLDTEDHDALGRVFDIAPQLAAEVMYVNDETDNYSVSLTPLGRWQLVREWAARQIRVRADELIQGEQPGRALLEKNGRG